MFVFIPFKKLLDLGVMREVRWNDGGNEVPGIPAIGLIEINEPKKAGFELAKKKLSLEFTRGLRNNGMSDGTRDGATKPGLVCLGLCRSEVPLLVKLSSSIGAALGSGELADGSREERQPHGDTRGRLGGHLPQFSLQECARTSVRKLQKSPDRRGFEDAGLVWPAICWVFHHCNATIGRNLKHAQQGDKEELVPNFQLGVFGNFEIRKPEHVLNGPNRAGWSPIGGCVGDGEDSSEPGN